MTLHMETILNHIGLNNKEAKIYIALLKLGESNIKSIADKSGIPRTSVYTPLESLIGKGAVEYYKRKGRNYYTATQPEKLIDINKKNIQLFSDNLDKFREIENASSSRPQIRFFSGKEEVKLLLDEILQEKRPFMAITSIEDMNKLVSEYFGDFIERRKNQNLPVRLLTNRSEDSFLLKKTDDEDMRETRFVPEKYNFSTANYIFGDNIAMLSLKDNPVFGVLMKDPQIAETHRMYFELIWEIAERD